jgi:hypothetical protein
VTLALLNKAEYTIARLSSGAPLARVLLRHSARVSRPRPQAMGMTIITYFDSFKAFLTSIGFCPYDIT